MIADQGRVICGIEHDHDRDKAAVCRSTDDGGKYIQHMSNRNNDRNEQNNENKGQEREGNMRAEGTQDTQGRGAGGDDQELGRNTGSGTEGRMSDQEGNSGRQAGSGMGQESSRGGSMSGGSQGGSMSGSQGGNRGGSQGGSSGGNSGSLGGSNSGGQGNSGSQGNSGR